MKFVITGQRGLIGTYLKKRLENEGNKCILEMDLRDGNDICYSMPSGKHKADVMFHLASNCKINKCIASPDWCFENVIAIHNILEFCRKNDIKKIVSFSSSRVLNKERNPYTASKLYMEELCKSYAACYGIKYIIIRPSTVYGPFNDETHRLIDIWVRAALNNNNLKIYGNPKVKTLDFTFIDDFIDGVMLILNEDKWNMEYNISGEEEVNLKDLAKFIIEETRGFSDIVIEGEEIQQPQTVSVDIDAIKKIGYTPKISIKEGVMETIKFYKEEGLQ